MLVVLILTIRVALSNGLIDVIMLFEYAMNIFMFGFHVLMLPVIGVNSFMVVTYAFGLFDAKGFHRNIGPF